MHRGFLTLTLVGVIVASVRSVGAQAADSLQVGYSRALCPSCAEWNAPATPVRLFGNAYYVGTRGLSAVLLTSSAGHILLDAGLPESAAQIIASIRALGFRVEDIKLLVNSHAHYDHAGGLAALKRASRAEVAAREPSAIILRRGSSGPDDPQYGIALSFPPVPDIRLIGDGDTLRVGAIVLTAHATAGHTPGGTTWSWRSCDDGRCLDFVYADSQTPVSADGFHAERDVPVGCSGLRARLRRARAAAV